MSTMVGSDADELDRLASRMHSTSVALGLLGKTIGVALAAAPWFGGFADMFRRRWGGEHARSLLETAGFLRENAQILRLNAQQQRDASAASGGPPSLSCDVRGGGSNDVLDRLAGGRSPDEVAEIWASLTPEQRAAIIKEHPDSIGNLDGIPPADRVAANRIRIDRDLAALEAAGDTSSPRYEMLKRLATFDTATDPTTKGPYGYPQVYLYDPTGQGRLAVIEGDLTNARNVGVYVPGTGASLDNADGDLLRGRNLFVGSEPGTAIVTWIGYDAPDGVYPTQNGQPLGDFQGNNAMLEKFADRGSQQLASSLAGLGVDRDANLTVIGHSYGSLVAVGGAHLHGGVDNIVVIGSPGVGFDHASQVNIDGGFYAMNAQGDPVGRLPIFGENPSDPRFGAERLSTADFGEDLHRVSGHSDYFDPTSTSAHNIAAIVGDNPELAVHHSTGIDEYAGDLVIAPSESVNWAVDRVQDRVDLPQPVDDVVDGGQGVGRAISGAVEWGVEASVDVIRRRFGRW